MRFTHERSCVRFLPNPVWFANILFVTPCRLQSTGPWSLNRRRESANGRESESESEKTVSHTLRDSPGLPPPEFYNEAVLTQPASLGPKYDTDQLHLLRNSSVLVQNCALRQGAKRKAQSARCYKITCRSESVPRFAFLDCTPVFPGFVMFFRGVLL